MDPIAPGGNCKKKQKIANSSVVLVPPLGKPPDPMSSTNSESCMEIEPLDEEFSSFQEKNLQINSFSFFESLKNKKQYNSPKGLFIPTADADQLFEILKKERYNLDILIKKQSKFEAKMTGTLEVMMQKIDQLTKDQTVQTTSMLTPKLNNPPLQSSIHARILNNTQNQPMKWSTAVKANLPATQNQFSKLNKVPLSLFNSQLIAPVPPPQNKILNLYKPSFFIIRHIPESNPFKEMDSAAIKEKVNQVLTELDARTADGGRVEVRGAAKMKSGDIKFYTPNRLMTSWCLNHKHKWTHLCDPTLITPPSVYPVILHSVPAHFDTSSNSDTLQLCKENNINPELVTSTRWMRKNTHMAHTKTHGSLVCNLTDRSLSLQVEKGGLFFQSNFLKGAKYNKSPTCCFNCFEIGHTAQLCKNAPFCSKCAGPHNSRNCEQIEDSDDNFCQRCVAAKRAEFLAADEEFDPTHESFDFNHSITSISCPSRSPTQTHHQDIIQLE